jgi:hypothetical protein
MDEAEARDILAAHLSPLRELPYDQLVRRLLDRVETAEAYGPSGAWYQLEVQGFCDAKPNEVSARHGRDRRRSGDGARTFR